MVFNFIVRELATRMKNGALLRIALAIALATSVATTPSTRHARAISTPSVASIETGTAMKTDSAGLNSIDVTASAMPGNETSNHFLAFVEKIKNASTTSNVQGALSKEIQNSNGVVNNLLGVGTKSSDVSQALVPKVSPDSSAEVETQLLFNLNSIVNGFGRGSPQAGFESSAFGGLVNDLLDVPGKSERPPEVVPDQGAVGLMSLVRGLGGSQDKDSSGSKPAIGGFDMMNIMRGFGVGPAAFPILLGALGIRRDQSAPGGSAPGGGSYDLTKLMAGLNTKTGDGVSGGNGANLGFLGGNLGFLGGNAPPSEAAGSAPAPAGFSFAGLLKGFLGGR